MSSEQCEVKHSFEAWLWSDDFAEVCTLAGVDPEAVRGDFYRRQDAAAGCTLAGLDAEAVAERFNPETYRKLIRAA